MFIGFRVSPFVSIYPGPLGCLDGVRRKLDFSIRTIMKRSYVDVHFPQFFKIKDKEFRHNKWPVQFKPKSRDAIFEWTHTITNEQNSFSSH